MRRLALLLLSGCGFIDPAVGARVEPGADATTDLDATIEAAAPGDAGVIFRRDIRPLLNREPDDPTGRGCRLCHFPNEGTHVGLDMTGLDLSSLGGLRKGGTRTKKDIILPGDPQHSAIVLKLRGTFDGGRRMPRNGPPYWTDQEIGIVETWIAEGAKGDDRE